MKPELKRIVLKGNQPDNIDDFVIAADADIGEEGFEGADYFHFRIVTPKRLMRWLEEDRIVNGRYTFVVNESTMEDNLKIVEDEINKVLQSCEGSTWEDVALAVSRHLKWEYDV
ncbi:MULTISPECIES: Imm8 family immunity protein [unclassified Paenibacillus]|uniref:Imm8 family immunity protein n=1 Tax=unclassified Paenibacillus TaxID=185978 RepID=UPI003836CD3D